MKAFFTAALSVIALCVIWVYPLQAVSLIVFVGVYVMVKG